MHIINEKKKWEGTYHIFIGVLKILADPKLANFGV
jgi:hypothetical protein